MSTIKRCHLPFEALAFAPAAGEVVARVSSVAARRKISSLASRAASAAAASASRSRVADLLPSAMNRSSLAARSPANQCWEATRGGRGHDGLRRDLRWKTPRRARGTRAVVMCYGRRRQVMSLTSTKSAVAATAILMAVAASGSAFAQAGGGGGGSTGGGSTGGGTGGTGGTMTSP